MVAKRRPAVASWPKATTSRSPARVSWRRSLSSAAFSWARRAAGRRGRVSTAAAPATAGGATAAARASCQFRVTIVAAVTASPTRLPTPVKARVAGKPPMAGTSLVNRAIVWPVWPLREKGTARAAQWASRR